MAGARRPTAVGPGAPGAGGEKLETADPRPMDGESTTVDPGPPSGFGEHEERTVSAKGRERHQRTSPGTEKEIGPSDSNVSCTETKVAEDSGQILLDTGAGIDLDDVTAREPADDGPTRDDGADDGGRLADGTGETVGNGKRPAKQAKPGARAATSAASAGLAASQVAPRSGVKAGSPGQGDAGAPSPPDARAVLTVVSGSDRGRKFEIARGAVKVGRGVDNDIILTDIAVSRHHLSIEFDGSGYVVCDLGSGNGTIVNDRDEEGRAALRDGDRLELGNTVIRFERPAQAGAHPSSAIATKEEVPRPRGARRPAISRRAAPGLPQPKPAQPGPPGAIRPVQQAPLGVPTDDDVDEDAATIAGRRPPDPPPGMAPIADLGYHGPKPVSPAPSAPEPPKMAAPAPPSGPPPGQMHPGGETPSAIRALGAPPIAPSPASAPIYPTAPQAFGGAGAAQAARQMPQGRLFAAPDPDPDRKKLAVAIVAVFSVVVLIGVVAAFFATGSDGTAFAESEAETSASESEKETSGGLSGFLGADSSQKAGDEDAEEAQEKESAEEEGEKESDAESMVERINRARAEASEEEAAGENAGEERTKETQEEEREDERGEAMVALVAGKRKMSPSTWGNEETFLSKIPSAEELERRIEKERGRAEEASRKEKTETRSDSRRRDPERTTRRPDSGGPDLGAARRRAQELYRKRQFAEAASVLRRAADDARGGQARRLNGVARGYDRLGSLLDRANHSSRSDAAAAWSGYRRALAADRDLGGAHAGFIRTRLRYSAKKAAMKLMAAGRYEQAKRAADDAPSSEVAFVYRSLEQKALGLYRKAEKLARQGQTAQAKDLLRRIKDMTKKGSTAWKKALKKLAQM